MHAPDRWNWLLSIGLTTCLLAIAGCSSEETPKSSDNGSANSDEDDTEADDTEADDSKDEDDGKDDDSDNADDDDGDTTAKPMDAGTNTKKDTGVATTKDTGVATTKDTGVATTKDTGVATSSPEAGTPKGDASTSPGTGATGAGCTPAPSGMFQTRTISNTGPGGGYTIVRPATLGEGGFKHPPVAWGNGLATTPSLYPELLQKVASNGFVVIANPGTGSDPQVVRQGLEWLIQQNGSGDYAGKLAVDCAGTIGYSMGGGAAVGSGSHPAVKAIVSIHGLQDQAARASGPILLTTSDDDGFVTPEGFVQPCYNASTKQPTIMAQHITGNSPSFNGHLEPLGNGGKDADPGIAWLRYWIYGDQSQKKWFFGADCTVCGSGWKVQRKNHNWD